MLKHYLLFFLFISLLLLTANSCLADEDQDVFDDGFGFEDEFAAENNKVYDPLIGFNRLMFKFNDRLYFIVLVPIGTTYSLVLSEKMRTSVNNFFLNLEFPVRFVNNLLQLKFKNTGIEMVRFGVNSTAGVLGFMDPAYTYLKLTPKDEDFGQTLGHYGVGEGFPLVLPFWGVLNLRDAIGEIPDGFLSPSFFVRNIYLKIAIFSFEKVNYVSLHIGEYEMIKKEALDPYTFTRDAYAQIRKKRIEE